MRPLLRGALREEAGEADGGTHLEREGRESEAPREAGVEVRGEEEEVGREGRAGGEEGGEGGRSGSGSSNSGRILMQSSFVNGFIPCEAVFLDMLVRVQRTHCCSSMSSEICESQENERRLCPEES